MPLWQSQAPDLVDAVRRVGLNVANPVANVVERRLVRAVVDEQNAHRAAVVRRGDGAETLLAGRVPLCVCVREGSSEKREGGQRTREDM